MCTIARIHTHSRGSAIYLKCTIRCIALPSMKLSGGEGGGSGVLRGGRGGGEGVGDGNWGGPLREGGIVLVRRWWGIIPLKDDTDWDSRGGCRGRGSGLGGGWRGGRGEGRRGGRGGKGERGGGGLPGRLGKEDGDGNEWRGL